jgi:hypothetical protein
VSHIDPRVFQKKSQAEEFQNLFETGCLHAAQAITQLRLEAIGNTIASEVREDSEYLKAQKCLRIIDLLDDFELYLLIAVARIIDERKSEYISTDKQDYDPPVEVLFNLHDLTAVSNKWFLGVDDSKISLPSDTFEMGQQSIGTLANNWLVRKNISQMNRRIVAWNITDLGVKVVEYVTGKLINHNPDESTTSKPEMTTSLLAPIDTPTWIRFTHCYEHTHLHWARTYAIQDTWRGESETTEDIMGFNPPNILRAVYFDDAPDFSVQTRRENLDKTLLPASTSLSKVRPYLPVARRLAAFGDSGIERMLAAFGPFDIQSHYGHSETNL